MDLSRPVNSDPRRALPSVDRLSRQLCSEMPELAPRVATEGARRAVAAARELLESEKDAGTIGVENSDPAGHSETIEALNAIDWLERARQEALALSRRHPTRVINATGVVLHTNLGRSPISASAAEAAARAAAGYSDLELDLGEGRRGNRLGALADKLCLLSGADAAYACNNNAAAVLLALNTLAAGREVIVSRGELVEIGGSFRVPEIMLRAGVVLVEVGSTNRTHARDYADAIGPRTALLLKVHRSNFEQRGFVKEVDLASLVEIGRERGVPVMEDLGSGTLIDLQPHGFPEESWAAGRLKLGPDVICFSGDKLMGGPQSGLVLGSRRVLDAMRSNPMARALRLDKMTLAALDETLSQMLEGRAEQALPVLRSILVPLSDLEVRTRAAAKRLTQACAGAPGGVSFELVRDTVPLGGGTLPGFELDTWVLEVRASAGGTSDVGVGEWSSALRSGVVPVLARARDDALLLDLRTVDEGDQVALERAVMDAVH
jgi:L-seryl-tRNA(Ser) seleniumtransferase